MSTNTSTDLADLVADVACARQHMDFLQLELAAERERFRAEHADLIERLDQATEHARTMEALLRERTLAAYAETGSKSPAPGVGIRVMKKPEYSEGVAFLWATEHRIALKLDTKAFEKIVMAMPEVDRPEWFTVHEVPTATIANDLSAVREDGDDD